MQIIDADRIYLLIFSFLNEKYLYTVYMDRSGPVLKSRTEDRKDRSKDRSLDRSYQDRSNPTHDKPDNNNVGVLND